MTNEKYEVSWISNNEVHRHHISYDELRLAQIFVKELRSSVWAKNVVVTRVVTTIERMEMDI